MDDRTISTIIYLYGYGFLFLLTKELKLNNSIGSIKISILKCCYQLFGEYHWRVSFPCSFLSLLLHVCQVSVLLCYMLFLSYLPQLQGSGSCWPWIEISETVRPTYIFHPISYYSQLFCHRTKNLLTQLFCWFQTIHNS
jgi:hypothetical protein